MVRELTQLFSCFFPSTHTYNATFHINHRHGSCQLKENERFHFLVWLLEAQKERCFTGIKYGLLVKLVNGKRFNLLNHVMLGDTRALRAILLCSILISV